jgi:hypothetical protein
MYVTILIQAALAKGRLLTDIESRLKLAIRFTRRKSNFANKGTRAALAVALVPFTLSS